MTLLTEEDAKTKQCPLVRYCSNQLAVIQDKDAPLYEQGNCIASDCMAWRQAPLIVNGSIHEIAQPRKGFCGALGWPA